MEKLTTLHEVKRETLDRLKELSEFNLSNFIEIAQNAMQSRYSPTQLISFKNSGICLSYMGTPIIASGGSQTESGYSFLFTYATMQTSSMSMTFRKMIVYPDLSITAATELMETAVTRLPLAVNGKKFTTADEITLVAGDIQAENGWSPTDDKDIATKKYVDDNAGNGFVAQNTAPADTSLLWIDTDDNTGETIEWSAIQNKPTSFPPSTHTHAYSDITNPPTIPIAGQIASGDTGYATGGDVFTALSTKQDKLPNGTANGDILVWDNTAQEWIVRSGWQILYQPVEYIESTGTQYINTGVLPQANMRVIVDTQYSAIPSSADSYIGGSTNATWAFVWASEGASGQWATIVNNSYTWVKFGTTDTNRHTWDLQSGSQKFDGTVISTSNFTQNITNVSFTMLHFARHTNSNTPNGWSKEKLYSLKYYYGDTLIRDFIPCYNRITNEIGLFDIVESKFYQNAGTGTFTKGANV